MERNIRREYPPNILKMKFVFVLLVVLPFVFCAPSERFILDSFGGLDSVLKVVESFAHSATTHDACVAECKNLVHGFLGSLCDLACTQALAAIPGGK